VEVLSRAAPLTDLADADNARNHGLVVGDLPKPIPRR
jgi:hypothetical protein